MLQRAFAIHFEDFPIETPNISFHFTKNKKMGKRRNLKTVLPP
jgi:hypothetical protein